MLYLACEIRDVWLNIIIELLTEFEPLLVAHYKHEPPVWLSL